MSPLEQDLADYLQLRHSLGHGVREARWLLPSFVAYLQQQGLRTVTVEATLTWAQQSPTGKGRSVAPRRMTAARGFAHYLSGIDPTTEVTAMGLIQNWQRRRRPFTNTPADIDAILSQARDCIVSPLRAATYQMLLGLLAVSGLRIGEAIKLDRSDVDWDQGVLLIRESRFGKSRLVPLHPSTMQALTQHARLRDELQPRPKDTSCLFVSVTRKRLSYAVVQDTFRQLINNAGVGTDAPSPPRLHDSTTPRLHDFRHSFAVHTLLRWYRSDEDVQAKIPSLSTYLGHREPASTYWYLSAAPELLALAAARQDTAWSAARQVTRSPMSS